MVLTIQFCGPECSSFTPHLCPGKKGGQKLFFCVAWCFETINQVTKLQFSYPLDDDNGDDDDGDDDDGDGDGDDDDHDDDDNDDPVELFQKRELIVILLLPFLLGKGGSAIPSVLVGDR